MTYIFSFALVLFILLFVLTLIFILINNSISKARQLIEEARSDIDAELKRRYDLVPNLVEAVKGYSGYEKSLLENVTTLRSKVSEDQSLVKKAVDSDKLSDGIKNIFAVAESYPDLKAKQSFLDLQKSLNEVEDNIQYARRYYNGSVREYNIKIYTFPGSLVARIVNTPREEFFSATEAEKENVEVKMN